MFSGIILLSIAACAFFFGPFGPGGQPDPTIIQTAPRPDFFFLWLYAVLSFLPPAAETPLLMIGPVIAIALLLGLPFFAGEGEKSWRRRPVAVLTILLTAVALGAFTQLGEHTPWSPVMDAWSGDSIPSQYLVRRTALERRGALVLQAKQCRNCHSLGGVGGKRGPALDTVAVRLTPSQLIRQVIQGGGNMPAYGKNLNPAETTAIVAFLETLHPAGQPPVDTFFRGASFCKYVCPIGQFNFLSSLVSPLEVRVRRQELCATCASHDCVRGNERQRGCELRLFLPRKVGNMDCTFCLDCMSSRQHWDSRDCSRTRPRERSRSVLAGTVLTPPGYSGTSPRSGLFGICERGILFSLYVGWRTARGYTSRPQEGLLLFAPWATVAAVLYAAGVWVVFQPMQMRGMVHG